jgi:SAM-dependent methyltransferase
MDPGGEADEAPAYGPAGNGPAGNGPAADHPAGNAPATDHPAGNAPATDRPAADRPTADAPTADAPTADHPTADHPTADAPTADAPTADHPAADGSADAARRDADWAERVRRGYDALSYAYRADDADEGRYKPWLDQLRARLAPGSAVLDLGCGNGVPVARALAGAGHRVTGLDISDVQVSRARRLVPAATFVRADAAVAQFATSSFDAVVCLYALIHLPLATQPALLGRVADWLRPGGWLLAVAGQTAWTGREVNWLGGPGTMWWSQADAASYRQWLTDAGLEITEQDFLPEGNSGHALFWARRPSAG